MIMRPDSRSITDPPTLRRSRSVTLLATVFALLVGIHFPGQTAAQQRGAAASPGSGTLQQLAPLRSATAGTRSVADASPEISGIIDAVSPDTLMLRVRELCGERLVDVDGAPVLIRNRYDGTGATNNDVAGDFLIEKLTGYGLLAGSQRFEGLRGRNVVAIQPGVTWPDVKLIICAHYDAAAFEYPGADDNASGTAAVLEAARLLSRYSFDYTIEYCLWDGEERGLIGSKFYARGARLLGDSIIGVINLDMIGWDSDDDSRANLQYNLDSGLPLVQTMQDVNDTYGIGLDLLVDRTPSTPSDNYSFTLQGYPSFLFIEDFSDFNIFYHKTTDQPDVLNVPFFTRITKTAIGGLVTLAGLRSAPQAPVLLAPMVMEAVPPPDVIHSWSRVDGAERYHFQLAEDVDFTRLVLDDANVMDTAMSFAGLAYNRVYFWRVLARGVTAESRWSEPRAYRTMLAPPMILTPDENATLAFDGVELRWSGVTGAQRYEVQIARSDSFSELVTERTDVVDTVYYSSPLGPNASYACRIRAMDGAFPGVWSPPLHFTTSAVSGIAQGTLPQEPRLLTPAPHPLSTQARIRFFLPQRMAVRLELFDLSGRSVLLVGAGEFDAGIRELPFSSAAIPAGIYLLRMTTPERVIVRPVIRGD